MEYLNKVTIRGQVGSVRTTDVQGKILTRMSVATQEVYKDGNNPMVVETTWHNVEGWDKEGLKLSDTKKGDKVYVEGRLKMQRYLNAEGHECTAYSIIASKFEKVTD